MPLTETVVLNIASAQRQIDELEADLRRLSQPINVPVDIEGTRAADELRQDFDQADTAVASLNNELEETGRELQTIDRRADDASDGILRVGTRGVSAFTSLQGSIVGVGAAFAAIAGARAFLGFAGEAIQAASNFEESLSKTNVVFGDFAGNVEEFATTGPQALGLSNAAALEATATFGNLFVALGLSQEEAAKLGPSIVQLAADLASFNNIEVAEAVEKLRAGLVGEAEPLRVLGVNINEAATQAKALELGLVGANGQVTDAAKVQARYALILEQTVTAQGDYARTADGIANTQRTLNAEWENAQTAIGQALLPAYQALIDLAPAVIQAIEDVTPVIAGLSQSAADSTPNVQAMADALQVLAEIPTAIGFVGNVLGGIAESVRGMTPLFIALNGGFGEVEDGVLRLGAAFENLDLSKLENDLINAVQRGEEPVNALSGALERLSDLDLDDEKFAKAAKAFVAISGVDAKGLGTLNTRLRTLGPALGFTTEELEVLRRELGLLSAEAVFSPEAFRLPSQLAEFDLANTRSEISDTAKAILDLSLAGESLAGFAPDLGTPGFVADLDTMTAAMDTARLAFKNDADEIITDFTAFVEDLGAELDARIEFERNLALLGDAGFDALAAVFRERGPEAAGLLAQAVTDPTGAAQAEADLDAFGGDMAEAEFTGFDTKLKQLIAGYDVMPVEIPLVFGSVGPLPTFPQLTGVIPAGVGGQGGFGPQSAGPTIIFQDTPAPSTVTQQITQSISRITGLIP